MVCKTTRHTNAAAHALLRSDIAPRAANSSSHCFAWGVTSVIPLFRGDLRLAVEPFSSGDGLFAYKFYLLYCLPEP